ncbi:MAG: hypothetical protein JKY27_07835 [Magnetovibrio sp.]|nr:hypothetical protein [Magnetovibrio sp.]
MVGSTSYEVQVMQGGKWRIHAHFPPSARDDAIEEAKALESMPGVAGIKVVRDEYDDRTGLHKEHIIYRFTPTTPPPSQDASGGKYDRYMARAQANRMDDIDFGDQPSSSRQAKSSGLGVVTKLLLILLFSIAFAALVTGLMNGFLPYKKIAGIKFYGEMRSNIMIGAAIITFLSSTLFSYLVFMSGEELDKPNLQLREKMKRLEAAKRQRAAAKAKAEQDKERKRDQKKRTQEEDKLKQQAEEDLKRKAKEQAEQPSAAEDSEDQKGDDADAKQAAEQEEKQEEEQEFSDLSPVAEAQKAVLMGFFGEAIRALPAERKKMDNYNRFGVNLYLAGAAEALGGVRNLDSESISKILAHSLGVMGLKAEHAEAFANRYEDYLLQDVRYMEMFQAGRQTIASYLDGDKEAPKLLDQSLQEWNKPKAPEDPEKEVVVMFTDIVGSTAMTHEKGNLAAQEVVRAHNRVVRDALAKTGGQEIKHTGDGIMASFQKVTDSLLSTQQMQMMIELHNQQLPDIPLKVKIGINAGRVVVEEQDLYGVTVQMAARIVDKAKADQIYVSDTVYGMAKGGNWRFVKRGPYYLKGIDGPVYLQELVWDDKVDIETVEAAAIAEHPQLEQAYAIASGTPLPGQVEPVAPNQPDQAQPVQSQPTQAQAPTTQAQPTQAAPTQATPPQATPSQARVQPQLGKPPQ